MKLIGLDRPASLDELPRSLLPTRYEPITIVRPDEIDQIASKPEQLVPVPEGANRKVRFLAQYRGRSHQGRLRSLANLKRTMSDPTKTTEIKQIPAGVPVPSQLPMVIPTVPGRDLAKGRFLRAATSIDEYNLYIDTWVEWFKDHSEEFTKVEDRQDVHMIALETVIQNRLLLLQAKDPKLSIETGYDQSVKRMERARDRLLATRKQRIEQEQGATAKKGGNTFNVAIIGGQLAQRTIQDRQAEADRKQKDLDDFLEGTVRGATNITNLIEGEVTNAQS